MALKVNFSKDPNQQSNADQKKRNSIIVGVSVVFVISLFLVYGRLGIIKIPGLSKTTASTSNSDSESKDKKATKNGGSIAGVNQGSSDASSSIVSSSQANPNATTSVLLVDPFSGPYNLIGVVLNKGGRNVAIIENNSKNFAVAEREIFDNIWLVESVQMNSVVLRYKDKTQVLNMP